MAQTKILIDSCCYFRLAQNIHPLLAVSFGKPAYTLYAHEALVAEFARSSRLQTKFDWVMRPEYRANRLRPLQIGRKEAKAIAATYEFLWAHVRTANLGPSPVDVRILAAAVELKLPMVTDDEDLRALARDYDVRTLGSLELMRLMVEEGHIDMEKVRMVVAQWRYDHDLPASPTVFETEYLARFGESPPKE